MNLLPFDGEVFYVKNFFSPEESLQYFNHLLEDIDWKNDETTIFGKKYITRRKVAWYGAEPFEYKYSNHTKTALLWNAVLKKILQRTQEITGEFYNSCLLNLYHSGEEGMGWHSDNEKVLKSGASIASISLGAERRFIFKHRKSGEKVEVLLENGSLLEMKGDTQQHWVHRLPPMKAVLTPRINLTFRTYLRC
jgi:alkylated DNA repair dioxygenase AlkB